MMRRLTCCCGHQMEVPAEALGAWKRCTACNENIHVTAHNSQHIQDSAAIESLWGDSSEGQDAWEAEPTVARELEAAARIQVLSHCARCGKAFQGPWDRYEADQGFLCHLCHNRYEYRTGRPPIPEPEFVDPLLPVLRERAYQQKREHWRRIKGTFQFAVFGMLCIGAIMLFPVEQWIAQVLIEGEAALKIVEPESAFWPYVSVFIGCISDGAITIGTLMLILLVAEKLPSQSGGNNLVFALKMCLLAILFHLPALIWPVWPGHLFTLGAAAFLLIENFEAEPRHLLLFAFLSAIGFLVRMLLTQSLTGLAAGIFL